MKKNRNLSAPLTQVETVWGIFYLIFEILVLPTLLAIVNVHLPRQMSSAELNFCYFLLNFLAVFWIFHGFLGKNMSQARNHPAYLCQAVILGLAAYFACSYLVDWLIHLISPGFANLNDDSIAKMTGSSFFLMALGTVVLVPPVEECLFRGLIFRGLYGKSRWAAYIVSMLAFAAIHVMNYITSYSPMNLLLSFLQYLPAGLCLAWAYTKADTIFAPILIHGIINAIGIYTMR